MHDRHDAEGAPASDRTEQLDRKSEEALIRQFQQGTVKEEKGDGEVVWHHNDAALEAYRKLVTSLLPLIRRLAWRRFRDATIPIDEIVNIGVVIFEKVLPSFDLHHASKARLATFAARHLLWEWPREIYNATGVFVLPAYYRKLLARIDKAQRQLASDGRGTPTTAEIAAHIGLPEWQVEKLLAFRGYIPLDAPIGDDGEDTLGSVIPDPKAVPPSVIIEEGKDPSVLQQWNPEVLRYVEQTFNALAGDEDHLRSERQSEQNAFRNWLCLTALDQELTRADRSVEAEGVSTWGMAGMLRSRLSDLLSGSVQPKVEHGPGEFRTTWTPALLHRYYLINHEDGMDRDF